MTEPWGRRIWEWAAGRGFQSPTADMSSTQRERAAGPTHQRLVDMSLNMSAEMSLAAAGLLSKPGGPRFTCRDTRPAPMHTVAGFAYGETCGLSGSPNLVGRSGRESGLGDQMDHTARRPVIAPAHPRREAFAGDLASALIGVRQAGTDAEVVDVGDDVTIGGLGGVVNRRPPVEPQAPGIATPLGRYVGVPPFAEPPDERVLDAVGAATGQPATHVRAFPQQAHLTNIRTWPVGGQRCTVAGKTSRSSCLLPVVWPVHRAVPRHRLDAAGA